MENNNQINAPIIDMNAVQEAANKAATEAVMYEVKEYYSGYNSPFKKQIKQYLEKNAPVQSNFELPNFAELLQNRLATEIEKLVNTIAIEKNVQYFTELFEQQEINNEGTVNISFVFKEMCKEIRDGYLEASIHKDDIYSWYKAKVKYKKREEDDELKFDFTIHNINGRLCVLSMPYSDKSYNTIKVKTKDGNTIELNSFMQLREHPILIPIAKLIMFDTALKLDVMDFSKYSEDDDF